MAFTPVELTRDGKTIIVDDADEDSRLRWDGWLPTGAPVADTSGQRVTLGDLRNPASPVGAEVREVLGSADPVLSAFVYDGSGNLTSYKEDGVTITLTYNADGTVATQKRGTGPVRAFSYTGGNLSGVA